MTNLNIAKARFLFIEGGKEKGGCNFFIASHNIFYYVGSYYTVFTVFKQIQLRKCVCFWMAV